MRKGNSIIVPSNIPIVWRQFSPFISRTIPTIRLRPVMKMNPKRLKNPNAVPGAISHMISSTPAMMNGSHAAIRGKADAPSLLSRSRFCRICLMSLPSVGCMIAITGLE